MFFSSKYELEFYLTKPFLSHISFFSLFSIKPYRCRRLDLKCPAKVWLQGEQIVENQASHNHPADFRTVVANARLSKMKYEMDGTGKKVRNVKGDNLAGLSPAVIAKMPAPENLDRILRRAGQETRIPVPQDRTFTIPDHLKSIVLEDTGPDDPDRIVFMGSQGLLDELAKASTCFADGTFKSVPNMFCQLYTLRCPVGNKYATCAYFLLPNKSRRTYERMIDMLKAKVPRLNVSEILVDFEQAAISAFADGLNVNVSCCFFHLRQSVRRKLGELGLIVRYNAETIFQEKVAQLIALTLVPVDDVPEVFDNIVEDTFADEDSEEVTQFLEYFENTYIRRPSFRGRPRTATFPPAIWNHYEHGLNEQPKTTNACEGYHHALNS